MRAAADCATPLVSAIGHENDRPLLDDVADLRASTPTDAAKRVVPDVGEQLATVQQARSRLITRLTSMLTAEIERVAQFRSRPALASATWIIDTRAEELTRLVARGAELTTRRLDSSLEALDERRRQLRALSPQRTLDRGYAIVQDDAGRVVSDAARASLDDALHVTLAAGRLTATVTGTEPSPNDTAPRTPTPSEGKQT